MLNYFEQFVKDELEWMYGSDDCVNVLIQEAGIDEDEFYDNLDNFIESAIKMFCNDEYIIQCLHDWMHDSLETVVESYMDSKNNRE